MAKLYSKIEKELSKAKTDRKTWEVVQSFWASEQDWGGLLPLALDRVELLEARMLAEHGWKR
jgi:hypothetical protein